MEKLRRWAPAWLASVLAVVVTDVLTPQPFGVSALGEIFEPYLVLAGLLAIPLVIGSPGRLGRALAMVLVLVAFVRYAPSWVSSPPAPNVPPEATLRVSAWNMLAGRNAVDRLRVGVASAEADLMSLEELNRDAIDALTDPNFDPELKYKALPPRGSASDVGLLSVFPISKSQISSNPPLLRALVEPSPGKAIVVYVVHAPLGRFVKLGDFIVGVDLNVRDRAMALIRARIDVDVAQNRSVIVLGDFNATEREPAYALVSAGLRDAHLDAGTGPGLSWRPPPLTTIPYGLLRIDYVLTTPDLAATSATVNCSVPSDHCRLDTTLNVTSSLSQD